MTDTTRRRFIRIATATAAVGLAGCSEGSGVDEDTEDAMDGTEAMDDGMNEDGMTESGMDDESMTDAEMTDAEMTEAMTDAGDEMTETGGEMTDTMAATETFQVTVTNVSEAGTLMTSQGDELAVPLSPTAYAVHTDDAATFTEGEAASDGLESLAEDGMPGDLRSELADTDGVEAAGAVTTAAGADEAGPLMPGDSYSFEVEAGHDHRLALATMFAQSNDLFYAPDPSGLALFEDGEPVTGDVTDHLTLWDAGTEANQEPGVGPDQAPRQSGADTGPEEDGTVRPVSQVMDEYEYPDASEVIEVSIATEM